jgi:hypothetical protein
MHWQRRDERKWSKFNFGLPYRRGFERLREVIEKTDYDPTVLWVWGTMQARAVIEVLKACEREFGEKGQKVVYESLRKVGREVAEQILEDVDFSELTDLREDEIMSFFATVVNRVAYASLEKPWIESSEKLGFDITWCPHQDVYAPFDCRVQRYIVQGMIDVLREKFKRERGHDLKFNIGFESTIPAGGEVCRFVMEKSDEEDKWEKYTEILNRKALEMAKKNKK